MPDRSAPLPERNDLLDHDPRTAAINDLELALESAEAMIANLRTALATSREIGAATGILMATRKLDQDAAFALLVRASQVTNRKVRDVAADVALTGTLPDAALAKLQVDGCS
jgi:hypothetical protein